WRGSFRRWSRRMRWRGSSRTLGGATVMTCCVSRAGATRTWPSTWSARGSRGMARRSSSGEAPSSPPPAPGRPRPVGGPMAEATLAGAERIAAAFERAQGEGRAALMPYMMAGYPDRETSMAVANAYADCGADLVELGVPFSDPLADGPTIHAAA